MTAPDISNVPAACDRLEFEVEDAKRYFGEWDVLDPVSWAIVRVVQAQNDLAYAITESVCYGRERMVEQAIAERLDAVDALRRAIKEEPRGFQ